MKGRAECVRLRLLAIRSLLLTFSSCPPHPPPPHSNASNGIWTRPEGTEDEEAKKESVKKRTIGYGGEEHPNL